MSKLREKHQLNQLGLREKLLKDVATIIGAYFTVFFNKSIFMVFFKLKVKTPCTVIRITVKLCDLPINVHYSNRS